MGEFKLDFTGIGVAKAGTSWIAQCLREHPSVCMAQGKETNFFLRKHMCTGLWDRQHYYLTAHYDRGLDWYEQKFSHHETGQLYGEFCNAYWGHPECAGLLHAHNPDMKLLCSFRNPVDAAYAGYCELSRFAPLPGTFDEAVLTYPQLLDYGRYHRNLQPFLDRFPRDQIHLMLFEDIKVDPVAFYRSICEFLEIDPSIAPRSLSERVHPRTVLRSRRLRDLRCALAGFMASTSATRSVRSWLVRIGAANLARSVYNLNEKPGTAPPMKPETRRRLVELYRKDNEALEDLLGRDLSHWNDSARDERPASASGTSAMEERSPS